MNKSRKLIVLVAALSLGLSACGEKKSTVAGASNAGVKVNNQAISVAELELKAGRDAAERMLGLPEAKLKHIIDMELMRQAAVQAGLDADKDIRARIADSERTILAMAYMEKQLAAVGNPTDADITNFYNSNPARFAERRLLDIHEFSLQPPAGKAAKIQAHLTPSLTVEAFNQWLTDSNIPHTSTPLKVTTNRLPEDVLLKLKNVSVGGTAVVGDEKQMNVIFVLGEQKQPLSLAEIKPEAMIMLMDKRKTETLDNAVKQLRAKAKLEYIAPYTEKGLPAKVE
jgi:EpsD family peptidyl-prolyl cis-trans isomerase